MFRRLIFFTFALVLGQQLYGQIEGIQQPIAIHQDSLQLINRGLSLKPFTEVFVDSFSNHSFQDIIHSNEFIPLEDFKFDRKYKRGRYKYWLRFGIDNRLDDRLSLSFFCGNFDSLALYTADGLEDSFGKMVKIDSTENPSKLVNASIIQVSPNSSSVYYLSIRNSPGIPRYITPTLISEKGLLLDLLIDSNDKWYILYFQMGALLIMCFYFLTQLIFKRSMILMYYNAYLFFMLIHLSRSIFMSHPTAQIYPPGFYNYMFYSLITMGVLLSYIQFVKQVVIQVISKEDKFITILNWMILGSCLWFLLDRALLFFDPTVAWKFSNIFHVLSMLFYFFISIQLLKRKDAILTVIASGTLLLNIFFLILIILKITISFSDTEMGTWINPATCLAVLTELFIFIFGIKKMETLNKQQTQSDLLKVKKEKDALISSVAFTNDIRRDEEDQLFIDNIKAIIIKNMDNSQFNAKQIYPMLGTNHVTLNKRLKEIIGMSTHQYIQHIKLEFSKQLVLNSDKSFSEIAYEIGLNDPAYFSKVFKKKFGKTPSSFRKQLEAEFQN